MQLLCTVAAALILASDPPQPRLAETATFQPPDGAVEVPTNARLLIHTPPFRTIRVTSEAPMTDVETEPYADAQLAELPDLEPNAGVSLVVDDAYAPLSLVWQTGADPDESPPGAVTSVEVVDDEAYWVQPTLLSTRLRIAVPEDDHGVAAILVLIQESNSSDEPPERAVLIESGASEAKLDTTWNFASTSENKVVRFQARAVDMAGNEGDWSEVIEATFEPPSAFGCECARASSRWSVGLAALLGALAVLARGPRRRRPTSEA